MFQKNLPNNELFESEVICLKITVKSLIFSFAFKRESIVIVLFRINKEVRKQ